MTSLRRDLNVVALMGGIGSEREVSLHSGGCVAEALEQAGLSVVRADVTPEDLSILDRDSVDVFFIALHGQFGEDGRLQEILHRRGLIYTGCGAEASRLAFDKLASKDRFEAAGVPVPPGMEVPRDVDEDTLSTRLESLGPKWVVKPVRQGSSVGVTLTDRATEAAAVAKRTVDEYGDCMVERYIAGRELTVGIVDGRALPIIEIRSVSEFYDYHAKYSDEQTQYVVDPIEDARLAARIQRLGETCFSTLGCRDFARVDFILGDDGEPYVLEVNTIPGFTTHSLLPKAAARAGMSMSDLCVRIVELALARRNSPTVR